MTSVATLFIDVDGISLSPSDIPLLSNPHTAGVILFGRNVQNPVQVRALTDQIRSINPDLIISTDQEGGRVARLRQGFTPLPAMGKLGKRYDKHPDNALSLAYEVGYLMACETLAVGIDMSFAPVLDIDNGSLVIGDRAFHQNIGAASVLASAFIEGMNDAGMGATGKHFPGHGSVMPDSHVADAEDLRSLEQIMAKDMQVFVDNLSKLSALMPAHVIFSRVDDKPAGFSSIWLQEIIRIKLGFDGVLFSDDLSMKAAHMAGDVCQRVTAALLAGCDAVLVCNDREGVLQVLDNIEQIIADNPHLLPQKNRLIHMKAPIPTWQGDIISTCMTAFDNYEHARLTVLNSNWQ